MYGRKWVLASGIVIFLAGSALAGISQDMIQLIVFRGVQGLGAGTIIANSYGVVADVFPPAQRGKSVGILGAVFALAVVIGPLAGGTVTDHLSWRWIFFLNLPVGIVALAVIVLGMADVRVPRSRRGVDYLGIITLVGAVIPLLLALTWAGIENAIRDLKYGVGLNHLPSGRFAANGAWLAVQTMAHNLARWTARIGLGERIATTKTLRRRFFSLAGRLTRSARRLTLHLPDRWPWAEKFSRALARLRAIPLPA